MTYNSQLISSDSAAVAPPPGEEDKYVLTKVNLLNIMREREWS